MADAFAAAHARLFGFGFEGRELIVDSLEVEAVSAPSPSAPRAGRASTIASRSSGQHARSTLPRCAGEEPAVLFPARLAQAAVHRVEHLASGDAVPAPRS